MTTTNAPALTIAESGTGRPALIIHGGGGPFTVASIAAHLAPTMHVIAPTVPGWNGTERPDGFTTVADVSQRFLDYLEEHDLTDAVVIGSSFGGWVAADMAARDQAGRVGEVIIIDGAGVEIPGETARDVSGMSPRELAEYAWHNPELGYRDPATIPAEQQAAQKANMQTMALYSGGPGMFDPTLRAKLAEVTVPALVIWGDSDRMFTPSYGEAFAESFANGRFELVKDAGHLPHLEQPDATFALIDAFI